ncbi:MAG: hypothetical protein KDA21_09390, partial [Phycisphaerales bacterium]|nr:hypothetical protein [Phycisphaerales bacterium]
SRLAEASGQARSATDAGRAAERPDTHHDLTDGTYTAPGAAGNGGTGGLNAADARAKGPDLKVTGAAIDPEPKLEEGIARLGRGDAIKVTWTVENAGNEAVAAAGWRDTLYFAPTPYASLEDPGSIHLGSFWVGDANGLDAGESYTMSRSIRLPEELDASGYLVVSADSRGRQDEANTANNRTVIPVIIGTGIGTGGEDEGDLRGGGGLFGDLDEITQLEKDVLLAGLDQLSTWASDVSVSGVLGQSIPIIDTTVGDLLGQAFGVPGQFTGLGQLLDARLSTPVQNYFITDTDGEWTFTELVAAVQDAWSNEVDVLGTISSVLNQNGEVGFDLDLSYSAQESLDLDFGEDFLNGNVRVLGGATVDVDTGIDIPLRFGIDLGELFDQSRAQLAGSGIDLAELALSSLFVESLDRNTDMTPDPLFAYAEGHASGADLELAIGFLGAEVSGGSLDVEAGVGLAWQNPVDGVTRATLGDLVGAPLIDTIDFFTDDADPNGGVSDPYLDLSLPFGARIGSYWLLGTEQMDGGLDPMASPRIEVSVSDLFAASPSSFVPTIANLSPTDPVIEAFTLIRNGDWLTLLRRVGEVLSGISESAGIDFDIPFVALGANNGTSGQNATASDFLDFGKGFDDAVLSGAVGASRGTTGIPFDTVQDFAEALLNANILNSLDDDIHWDAMTREITFDLSFAETFDLASRTFAYDFQQSVGNVKLVSGAAEAEFTASADATFDMTLGMSLRGLGDVLYDLSGGGTSSTLSAGVLLASLNGGRGVRLTGDENEESELDFTLSDGSQFSLNLATATPLMGPDPTLGNLATAISQASSGKVALSFNDDALVLTEIGVTPSGDVLTVQDASLFAAIELGIAGSDLDGDGQIVGVPLHGQSLEDRFFLEDTSLHGDLDLSVDLAAAAREARAALELNLGVLTIGADTANLLVHGEADVSLRNPDSGALLGDRASLAQLIESVSGGSSGDRSPIDAQFGGDASLDIHDISIDGLAGWVNGEGYVTVTVADLTSPGDVDVESDFEFLLGIQNIIDIETIQNVVTTFINQHIRPLFEDAQFLGWKIPIVNKTVGELIGVQNGDELIDMLVDTVNELIDDNYAPTLQGITDALNNFFTNTFGPRSGGGRWVDIKLPGDDGRGGILPNTVIDFEIDFEEAFNVDVPLALGFGDLAQYGIQQTGSAPSAASNYLLSTDGMLNVTGRVFGEFKLGLDLKDGSFGAFAYEGTFVEAEANINATNLSLSAGVGGVGFFISNGTVKLDDGTPDEDPVRLRIAIEDDNDGNVDRYFFVGSNTDPNDGFDDHGISINDFDATLEGTLAANLPSAFPFVGNPVGAIDINLPFNDFDFSNG